MNTQDYLYQVHLLEASYYEQNRLLQLLQSRMHWLDSFRKKAYVSAKTQSSGELAFKIIFSTIFGLLIIAGGVLLIAFRLKLIGIGAIIWGALTPVSCILMETDNDAKEERKANEINAEIDEHNAFVQEIPTRQAIVQQQINLAEATLNKTRRTLDQFYSLNVIYPKYRNMAAVTTFYEYFNSGRCSSLTGHEGAYNLYENEVTMGIIINKLDQVIERLDQIQQNQYMLASAIRQSNAKADQVYNEICKCEEQLRDINNNTIVSGYFSAISAVNSASIAKYLRR